MPYIPADPQDIMAALLRTLKKPKSERHPRGRPGPPPIGLAPLTVDEALAAMLKTPPPPKDKPKKSKKERG